MDEGLDGEFDEEKRLGNEVVAAGHHGTGAVVEVAEGGNENDRSFLVQRQIGRASCRERV